MSELKNITPKKLLWLDLEMTGLNPAKHKIIEVAAVITDWDFNELATFEAIVKQPKSVLANMDDWPRKQHTASGLLAKVGEGIDSSAAEQELCNLIGAHFGSGPALLAGNSIHTDRQFIRVEWPKVEAKLHYRMLDVTAWKVVMVGKYGIEFSKKDTHRALDDIRESIAELQFYLNHKY